MIDVRNQLDRWAAPETVEWHFACIANRWTKRALVSAGFGYPTPSSSAFDRWKPIFSVAEIGGSESAAATAQRRENKKERSRSIGVVGDVIHPDTSSSVGGDGSDLSKEVTTKSYGAQTNIAPRVAVVHGINRPLFHMDLTSALQSAISSIEWKQEEEKDI